VNSERERESENGHEIREVSPKEGGYAGKHLWKPYVLSLRRGADQPSGD